MRYETPSSDEALIRRYALACRCVCALYLGEGTRMNSLCAEKERAVLWPFPNAFRLAEQQETLLRCGQESVRWSGHDLGVRCMGGGEPEEQKAWNVVRAIASAALEVLDRKNAVWKVKQ
ncbi:hypothetical protein EAH_00068520 [Eimeria acervulina]|uniref:Uncharacterized protein n=1 Tax=Eimeria acervulina TaxID=5801 RepID=U6GX90_EIMAC|nr:hypothetical protein EAH_00068520 [Eimeria acervulina]CDI83149.1 hypothetical protein EAH_00068520 [Eimeria acervulina]